MAESPVILYMSGTLPTRSETFVYREILALRDLGLTVHTASVHAPARDLNAPALDRMAAETIAVYPRGVARILADAAAELVRRPRRTLRTMSRCVRHALRSPDVTRARRPKVLWQGLAALSLARRVRPLGVAHVHAHMAHVPATIAMYAAQHLGVGFSFTGHANDLFPNRTLLREKLAAARWVHCISEWHRRFYQSIVPRPDADYPVVRCGVDTAAYQPTPAPNADTLQVLAVGRLVEKKGFDVLIRALGEIAGSGGPPVRARIAGGGEQEAALRALAADLPPGTVEFLGDTPNDRVLALMAQADLFVIPCRVTRSGDRDGIPVVLMEAMARGRCVVSGDLETIRELVRHGRTGVMVPPGDPAALAGALVELARDRAKIDELGRAGRRLVEQEFDQRVNARRIIETMKRCGLCVPDSGRAG